MVVVHVECQQSDVLRYTLSKKTSHIYKQLRNGVRHMSQLIYILVVLCVKIAYIFPYNEITNDFFSV